MPKINGAGTYASGKNYWYDMYTGQYSKLQQMKAGINRDDTHNYSTQNGVLASTTGNVTGIYDINGGSWGKE